MDGLWRSLFGRVCEWKNGCCTVCLFLFLLPRPCLSMYAFGIRIGGEQGCVCSSWCKLPYVAMFCQCRFCLLKRCGRLHSLIPLTNITLCSSVFAVESIQRLGYGPTVEMPDNPLSRDHTFVNRIPVIHSQSCVVRWRQPRWTSSIWCWHTIHLHSFTCLLNAPASRYQHLIKCFWY